MIINKDIETAAENYATDQAFYISNSIGELDLKYAYIAGFRHQSENKGRSAGVWICGYMHKPSDDDGEDFPRQYVVRFKGDDPRSGWVDIALMSSKEIRECEYPDYWEWLDESPSLPVVVNSAELENERLKRELFAYQSVQAD